MFQVLFFFLCFGNIIKLSKRTKSHQEYNHKMKIRHTHKEILIQQLPNTQAVPNHKFLKRERHLLNHNQCFFQVLSRWNQSFYFIEHSILYLSNLYHLQSEIQKKISRHMEMPINSAAGPSMAILNCTLCTQLEQ